jgi:regulator of replication initiation timing
MITHISEKETQLVSMLRKTGEALDACTAERDALKWDNEQLRRCAEVQEVDRYAALNRKYVKERDTYQREADKLAMENKTLRDALTRLRHWAEADNAHYTGDHPVALARAALTRSKS